MVLLNTADKLYKGTQEALRAYLGSQLVWEADSGVPVPNVDYYWNCDAGVVGQPLTAADVGSGTPFDSVTGTGFVYAENGKIGKCLTISQAGNSAQYGQWNNAAVTKVACGFWFSQSFIPSAETRILQLRSTPTSGTVGGLLSTNSGGVPTIKLMVASSGYSTNWLQNWSLDTWYWVTLWWDATSKSARIRMYNADGSLFKETPILTTTTTYANFQSFMFGIPLANISGTGWEWDEMQVKLNATDTLPPWMGVAA